MPVVQIEHPIRDFEIWKTAFDHDPVQREASGVRAIGSTVRSTTRTTSPWTSSSTTGAGPRRSSGHSRNCGDRRRPRRRSAARHGHASWTRWRPGPTDRWPRLAQSASRFSVSASLARFASRVFMTLPATRIGSTSGVGRRRAARAAGRLGGLARLQPALHPRADRRLVALVGGPVVAPLAELLGQVALVDVGALVVVRVAVADAEAVVLALGVGRAAQVVRDGQRALGGDVRHGRPVGEPGAVALRRRRDVRWSPGRARTAPPAGPPSRAPGRPRPPRTVPAGRRCRRPRWR